SCIATQIDSLTPLRRYWTRDYHRCMPQMSISPITRLIISMSKGWRYTLFVTLAIITLVSAGYFLWRQRGSQLLWQATYQRNYQILASLPYLISIDPINTNRDTPLLFAVRQNDSTLVESLIHAGADVNYTNMQTGDTPLILAVQLADSAIAKLVLEADVQVDQANPYSGDNALLIAASNNRMDMVHLLVEAGADINWVRPTIRATAINLVNDPAVVDFLALHGADLNALGPSSQTPLMQAVNANNIPLVKKLLALGVDYDAHGGTWQTPLMLAALSGNDEVTQILLDVGADTTIADTNSRTPFLMAAQSGYADVVRIYLEHGADPNEEDRAGNRVLYTAAWSGQRAVVDLLIDAGAIVDPNHEQGIAALEAALANGNNEGAERFYELGFAVTEQYIENRLLRRLGLTRDSLGLYAAIQKGNLEAIRILYQSGIRLWPEYEGRLLYDTAVRQQTEVIDLLLELGEDPNESIAQGLTPLNVAVWHDDPALIEHLLQAGANPNQQTAHGRTALMWAAWWSKHEALRFLLQQQINLEIVDREGRTALDYAQLVNNQQGIQQITSAMQGTTNESTNHGP
ncbi:MAG: ankyrin repeat domain-containing protein, partial [Planctomycetales bacterium]|nr:ankyrin repeat domain-containing protein [Planctomycetales bacterium]